MAFPMDIEKATVPQGMEVIGTNNQLGSYMETILPNRDHQAAILRAHRYGTECSYCEEHPEERACCDTSRLSAELAARSLLLRGRVGYAGSGIHQFACQRNTMLRSLTEGKDIGIGWKHDQHTHTETVLASDNQRYIFKNGMRIDTWYDRRWKGIVSDQKFDIEKYRRERRTGIKEACVVEAPQKESEYGPTSQSERRVNMNQPMFCIVSSSAEDVLKTLKEQQQNK